MENHTLGRQLEREKLTPFRGRISLCARGFPSIDSVATTAKTSRLDRVTREERVRETLFRGDALALANPLYLRTVRGLTDELLREDAEPGDLTVEALSLGAQRGSVEIRAKEAGIAAGVEEAVWLYERHGQAATRGKQDGHAFISGDVLLRVEGVAAELLMLERVVVNLLQRMSGIATATRRLVEIVRRAAPSPHVIATRKTPLGLLDKRAVHCGGGGTHRLSLSDAILIKTNHLRLASNGMPMDLGPILRGAWARRKAAAFFEVEVTSCEEALAAARILAELQAEPDACPGLLLLDNFSVQDAARTVEALRGANLHDAVLVEASGGISEASVAAYAGAGVDAISLGQLTHSVHALDLSAKLTPMNDGMKA
jgi:nicotinate-nucleotide pyrophosphorylase (carboxylating)